MAHKCCVFAAVAGAILLHAQTRDNTQGLVTGTVVNSVTGEPISGALVIANFFPRFVPDQTGPRQPIPVQRAVTGAGGGFSFNAGDAGGGSVQVSRPGYRGENIQNAAIAAIPPDFGSVTVRMVPQCVVTGRALNGDGEPLSGMTVEAIRIEIQDGRRELRENYGRAATDDRGEYRIWNLPPGLYYVKFQGRVSMSNFYTANAAFPFGDTSYGPVYYPSAANLESAQTLKIGAGQTINAPFNVEGSRASQIRGKMINAPAGRTFQIRLLRGADTAASRGAVNMAAGTFQVADVVPGSYTVQIYTSDSGPVRAGEASVTVGQRDLTGVTVPMSAGIEVRGRYPSAGARPNGGLRARRIDSLAAPGTASEVYATPDPAGGDFSFKGLFPGHYEILANGATSEGYITGIRSGNVDVMAEGLTVTSSGAPDLVVDSNTGGGTLQVTVEGLPAQSDLRSLSFGTSLAQFLLVGQSGLKPTYRAEQVFINPSKVDFLAPGDYTLYAWPSKHQIEFRNPAVLASLSQFAVTVRIGDGETKDVTVKPIPEEALP